MNKIKIAALIGAAFLTADVASAADIYKSDDASLSVYGRVKAEVLNGYGYQAVSAKDGAEDHPFLGGEPLFPRGSCRTVPGACRQSDPGIRIFRHKLALPLVPS